MSTQFGHQVPCPVMVPFTYCPESIKILKNKGMDFDGFRVIRVIMKLEGLSVFANMTAYRVVLRVTYRRISFQTLQISDALQMLFFQYLHPRLTQAARKQR